MNVSSALLIIKLAHMHLPTLLAAATDRAGCHKINQKDSISSSRFSSCGCVDALPVEDSCGWISGPSGQPTAFPAYGFTISTFTQAQQEGGLVDTVLIDNIGRQEL